ncbi:MAG TPA: squalene/phytoene synthase family protein [Rhodanobacteraceae bacterium]|nr:squalene/phytoene synthase family protein [Rhodanobacteraceae bacterium]
MSGEASAEVASFEAKWSAAHPEFGLALAFARGPDRAAASAFACLVCEIEHAAFGIREAQPAAVKLQWWAEEFARAARGEARHPLTQALAERLASAPVPPLAWHDVVVGALAQRDPEPAADAAALFEGYDRLYSPLATIDAALFGADARAAAATLSATRALRDTAALVDVLRDGKLPLPLDLLARHRLARGDLASASAPREAALSEWLTTLSERLRSSTTREQPIGSLRGAMAGVNAIRAARAAASAAPLDTLRDLLARLSLPTTWAAWRAARRSRT